MDDKIHPKGRGQDPGAEFLIWDPLHKFGMGKARKYKFVTGIDLGKSHLTDEKGGVVGSRAKFENFGTPFINLEWV